MNRFRDDGPPLKKYRNDRSDFSNSRGNTSDGGGAGHDGPRRGGGDDRFQSSSGPGRGGAGRFEKNPDIERHNAPPSRVLHVRGLRDYATQNDLVDAVKNFGRVTYVMMLPRNRQALIEFENVDCAKQVVRFLETSAIYVCGQPAFFNFSTSDSIKRPEGVPDFDQGPMNSSESKILVIVVQNPKYPITVDVMHTICSPHGDVLRIMVMRKQTVTALVEFDSYDSAQKAKQALHGCDVYSGCCTLKIEFAGPELQRLNVMKNDKETFDYTNPNPGAAGRSLLGDGPPGGFGGSGGGGWDDGGNNQNSFNEPFSNSGFNNQRGGAMGNDSFNGPGGGGGGFNRGNMGGMGGNFNDGGFGGRGGRGGGRGGFHGGRGGFQGGRGGMSGPMMGMGGPGGGGGPMPGSVLLIYGLATGKFTCDKLFNIFCIYGNVVSVKILRTKEGGAMINMQDHASCERAIMNLNHAYFFGKALSVSFSKQEFVKIHPNPSELDDGTPSARDYSNNKNNRFFSPDSINKTRFSPPTKVLHFFNAPPTFTEEEMMEVMKNTGTAAPERVRVFPIKAGARSAAGLIEYAGLDDACETIVCANHTIIPNPTGKMPFSLKLSFSASPIIDKPMGRDRGDREAGGDRDN